MKAEEIEESVLKSILDDEFGIHGTLQALAGEVDYNYKVTAAEATYLLKICKPDVPLSEVEFQISLLDFLKSSDLEVDIPNIFHSLTGAAYVRKSIGSNVCTIRVYSWVQGEVLDVLPHRSDELLHSWGSLCGALSASLSGFDHVGAHRDDLWAPSACLDMKRFRSAITDQGRLELMDHFFDYFALTVMPVIDQLRHGVNYSDAHEQNILVDVDGNISGLIDFGDAIYGPVVTELAIACAYAGMGTQDPIVAMCHLVRGYVSRHTLSDLDLQVLYGMIIGRLLITVSMAANNMVARPENAYLQVSAEPAWDLLSKLKKVHPQIAHFSFRAAAGCISNPDRIAFDKYAADNADAFCHPISLTERASCPIDLSVGSHTLGNNSDFLHLPNFDKKIKRFLEDEAVDVAIGGYSEIRPFYTTDAYQTEGNNGPEWRTMHLGTDYWLVEGSEVFAVHDGVVRSVQNNDAACDYGPTIILEHQTLDGLVFYTLYGHLALDALDTEPGTIVTKGSKVATVGASDVNGGWSAHLHFQVVLDLFDYVGDFPGVCYTDLSEMWLSNSPQLFAYHTAPSRPDAATILADRHNHLGRSLSISYNEPLHIVRGYGQYLYDVKGRRYLDTVNNVAHVGHEHPKIVNVISRQASVLNTNTRYLHSNITTYAKALASRCPDGLEVVYLVNSGSEANELALRMSKVWSGQRDVVALESGYHGNTGATIDVSSYKFDGKGGRGAPQYTSVVPMPDTYRGAYRDRDTAGVDYAAFVSDAVDAIAAKGRGVSAFLAESILSCGGQVVLPDGYLKTCYSMIRAAGGLCIADEVQVGFGRVGECFWGFELQGVVPDIIVCGKPIGNGHPLAAVVTTRAVSDAFTNGMEYFNTFGGNPVSCAVGLEVLNVIRDEKLQENALETGTYLKSMLTDLMHRHTIIGDVRGHGFFLGIELVRDRTTLEPADKEATYVVDRMRQLGILMSTDGPLHNVLKIKPPMCFDRSNADELVYRLDVVLAEMGYAM